MAAAERASYGGLTGLDKAETAAKHGDEQVKIWRRSFDVPPPPAEAGGEFDVSNDIRYKGIDVPQTESLKDTIARVLPYWEERIAPALRDGNRVLISAHATRCARWSSICRTSRTTRSPGWKSRPPSRSSTNWPTT